MRLFVGNIPYTFAENDVLQWFRDHGFIAQRAELIRDPANHDGRRHRGFGFVELDGAGRPEGAIIATLNGQRCGDRKLTVNTATPRTPRAGYATNKKTPH